MSVTNAPALLVALQGKSEPSAAKGDLSGLPYDCGDAINIWALPVAKIAVTEAVRINLREGIFL